MLLQREFLIIQNIIRGYKSDEIENVLGYKYDDNVIHIDNLTIL